MKIWMRLGMLLFYAAIPSYSLATDGPAFDQTHSAWTRILKKTVTMSGSQSRVNYASLKQHPEEIDAYLGTLSRVSDAEFSRMSEERRLAFLINAYNAFTVKLIIDHYPVKSIRDIGGLFSNPWKMKFFKLFGEEHRLDDIEHEMIRKKFNEPRIHFALVCASKGCPALRNEAYVAERLDQQLDAAANAFLGDTSRNRFDAKEHTLYLSSIFKWYGDDFEKKFGSVKTFVASRMTKDAAAQTGIRSEATTITYLDYDWSLNGSD